jgi:hypothetical protein
MRMEAHVNTASEEIATIRAELVDSEPLIWREIEVPASATLKDLHEMMQVIFGWADYHLWEFTIRGKVYGLPMEDDDDDLPRENAAKIRLRDVLHGPKTVIDYLYDFGDSWEHRLTVSKLRLADPALPYPRYVQGERNSPIEDCGGLPGYYELLDARENPKHPDHHEACDFLEDYDPDEIADMAIAFGLGRIVRRFNRAKAGAKKAK